MAKPKLIDWVPSVDLRRVSRYQVRTLMEETYATLPKKGEVVLFTNKRNDNFRLIHGGDAFIVEFYEGLQDKKLSAWQQYRSQVLSRFGMQSDMRSAIKEG